MTVSLTTKQIAALRALERDALPGPWRAKRASASNDWFDRHTADGSTPLESTGTAFALGVAIGVTADPGDAKLIAALRDHAEALLDAAEERDRLRAKCGELEKSVEEYLSAGQIDLCGVRDELRRLAKGGGT